MAKNNQINLASIQPIRYGLKGMIVEYSRVETGANKLNWNNEHTTTFKAPVQPIMRDLFNKFLDEIRLVAAFDKDYVQSGTMELVKLNYNAEGTIKAKFKVLDRSGNNMFVDMKKITADSDIENYQELAGICNQIWEETAKYLMGKTEVDTKQYMLDLFTEAESKNKEFAYTKEDIEGMSKEQRLEYFREHLRENGDIIIEGATAEA